MTLYFWTEKNITLQIFYLLRQRNYEVNHCHFIQKLSPLFHAAFSTIYQPSLGGNSQSSELHAVSRNK